jgi:hypothetical protein
MSASYTNAEFSDLDATRSIVKIRRVYSGGPMLNPTQKKHLADLEREATFVSFERTKYTFASDPKGNAEWDRLWARKAELEKEIAKLKAIDNVSTASTFIPTIPIQA